MFNNVKIFTAILLALTLSVSALPVDNNMHVRTVLISGDEHDGHHDHFVKVEGDDVTIQRRAGGDAYTGSSGSTNGGDATTLQGGLLALNALNLGKNGGRGGQSTTGNAMGGNGGGAVSVAPVPVAAPAAAPVDVYHSDAPAAAPAAAVAEPVMMDCEGGDAYTGSAGPAEGGDSITTQKGIINANLLNFGANGGRGGASGSGSATGGNCRRAL